MSLPYFFVNEYNQEMVLVLDEDTSRHVVSVLRMENGEQLHLTDGKGHLMTATIVDAHKKRCTVNIDQQHFEERKGAAVSIAISLVKNVSRMEWFLEKATEMGVTAIFPLLCHRTEKQHFRLDRMRQILVSAMLQSQQVWLPEISAPVAFPDLVNKEKADHRWIAHCLEEERLSLRELTPASGSQLILIGPEGDFTAEEISLALSNGFKAVMLGATRLRTETAGMVAASLMCIR
ncbi:16S rRNA (uracil(1498)-N(3))-methyltransferase [Flavihumibacter rivuli]|uniref:RsmE family RNA methyltransferase n=1 Tax=Flavihumibacter rivuli TaxID=2838156 RepID=UPI001BDEB3A0|nr:RsmE family RNA methyltransferase [Flavihumibacter rivuli]ULQ56456.1 16S rRNA (uracil(1498)-N(3))-methyltransferase [Flavihumibacter rivuli]